jgi:hypothetical protein
VVGHLGWWYVARMAVVADGCLADAGMICPRYPSMDTQSNAIY